MHLFSDNTFRLDLCLLIVVFLVGQLVPEIEALRPAFSSRRHFFSKVASTGGLIVATAGTCPSNAWATVAPVPPAKKQGRPALRGGKEVIDSTHNGTELNEKEANVADGLLSKMGLNDVNPDNGGRNGPNRGRFTTSNGVTPSR
eukprot:CAMPEP_0171313294 /NCGR_PEP_ID=MMETSP0816-20121228/40410_1 /TAXON_ID=420281 /ORGANISM="Proboscia inermis, Strain CCAP1064/1" /LENGTH=143 /DNA_ID=CAMNT_0011800449 /DNA_START=37 /DNA_END=468 /DNA_ORIENTATION=+